MPQASAPLPTVTVTFDPPSGTKRVGTAVRRVLQGRGWRWVVAAYVTRDEVRALAQRGGARGHSPRPVLLCDPFQGNCNPKLLRRLARTAKVYCRPRLHAKVYRGPNGIALGSANLSESGLGTSGLLESMVAIRDPVVTKQADDWFNGLLVAKGTERLGALVADAGRWAVIEAAYASKTGGAFAPSRGRARATPRRRADDRPEISKVLTDPTLPVGPVIFEFISGATRLSANQAQEVAEASGVELEDGWDFTERQPHGRAGVIRRDLAWVGSEVIALWGSGRSIGGRLRPLHFTNATTPERLVAVLPGPGRRVLYFYAPCAQRFRFTTRSIYSLMKRLNKGLQAQPVAKRPSLDGFFTAPLLADLLVSASGRDPAGARGSTR